MGLTSRRLSSTMGLTRRCSEGTPCCAMPLLCLPDIVPPILGARQALLWAHIQSSTTDLAHGAQTTTRLLCL